MYVKDQPFFGKTDVPFSIFDDNFFDWDCYLNSLGKFEDLFIDPGITISRGRFFDSLSLRTSMFREDHFYLRDKFFYKPFFSSFVN